MFSFFLPKHVREGRNLVKDATKLLDYKRDLWSDAVVSDFEMQLAALEGAVKARDKQRIEELAGKLDAICNANLPPLKNPGMRENVEVFLVAIVVALGVRTYFLQPFTIPTGSMQPTLNGILGYPTTEPPPNVLLRAAQFAIYGRDWMNAVATTDGEQVVAVEEYKSLFGIRGRGFTKTEVVTTAGRYSVSASRDTLVRQFLKPAGYVYKAGEPIVRGYVDTGDHVFVDKMSYNFRSPRRGEVFVFNTQNVPTNENRMRPGGPSQFYIKRLAGLPGDELRVAPPQLFVNGELAEEPAFARVMSGTIENPHDGYQGYANKSARSVSGDYAVKEYESQQALPAAERSIARQGDAYFALEPMNILNAPDTRFSVPPKSYFAMGDNSYHSSDSRDWGPVPERNLMGHGVFVYWPFGKHWGLIR